MPLYPERRYNFCIWGRLGPNSPPSVDTRLHLHFSLDPSSTLTVTLVSLNTTWQQYCIQNFRPVVATSGFFSLFLGSTAATYDLDDVTMRSARDDGPPPEGFYTLSKNALLSTFEAINLPFTKKFVLHNQPVISASPVLWVGVTDLEGNGSVSRRKGAGGGGSLGARAAQRDHMPRASVRAGGGSAPAPLPPPPPCAFEFLWPAVP